MIYQSKHIPTERAAQSARRLTHARWEHEMEPRFPLWMGVMIVAFIAIVIFA